MDAYASTPTGLNPDYFVTVFASMAGHAVLLQANPPRYTILAVTDDYCRAAGRSKEELVGSDFFDFLQTIPQEKAFANWPDMQASLEKVMQTKKPDHLPVQRYNIPTATGGFAAKYLTVTNKPILDEGGNLLYIIHLAEDGTDRVLAERQAETINQLKRTENLLMQMPVAMHIFKGEDLIIAEANEHSLIQWNRGREVIGKPLFEVLPETKTQGFGDRMRNVMRTGQVQEFYEHPVQLQRYGHTETAYFNFTYRPFYENGIVEPAGVLVVGTEVTDKVLAKRELEEKEQRLELAVRIAGLGDFKIDIVNNSATYSRQIMDWFSLVRQDEMVEKIFARIHPDDQASVVEVIARSANGAGEGRHDITYRVTDAGGVLRHLRSIGKVQFEAGSAVAIYGMLQDVTEQMMMKEAIERTVVERTEELQKTHASLSAANAYLHTVINLFQEPLQVLEPIFVNGEIIDFYFKLTNAAYAAYANTTPENLVEKKVSEFFPNYFQTSSFTRVADTFKTGKADTWEIHYNQDGLELYNIMSAVRMDGSVIVHFTDVTKLKNLQLELVQKIAELERSNHHLEEFAHAASHDLKEPIRKIQVFTGQLKSNLTHELQEREARLLSRIEDAGRRMGQLVDDLLMYSHVSQKPPEKEDVHLIEKVQQVIEDLELNIQEKGAMVSVEPLPIVRGYTRQLQQLFQNLIGNAIKYSKRDVPPHVHITSTRTEMEGRLYYVISIQDNGIGFDQEYAEKIFGMFTRLHGNAEYTGNGVGLAIVKKVVENHNGIIRTESQPDQGSTFKVFLPA